jgi:hypothetical protein
MQLIRLGDDALAEFFGRWVTGALDVYMQARRGAQQVATYNPFAAMPFGAMWDLGVLVVLFVAIPAAGGSVAGIVVALSGGGSARVTGE